MFGKLIDKGSNEQVISSVTKPCGGNTGNPCGGNKSSYRNDEGNVNVIFNLNSQNEIPVNLDNFENSTLNPTSQAPQSQVQYISVPVNNTVSQDANYNPTPILAANPDSTNSTNMQYLVNPNTGGTSSNMQYLVNPNTGGTSSNMQYLVNPNNSASTINPVNPIIAPAPIVQQAPVQTKTEYLSNAWM